MTRKRFVKLLIGKFGYGRDFANEIAFSVRSNGGTYADNFFWLWVICAMQRIRL